MSLEYRECTRVIRSMVNPFYVTDFFVPREGPESRVELVAIADCLSSSKHIDSPPGPAVMADMRTCLPTADDLLRALDETAAREALQLHAVIRHLLFTVCAEPAT